MAEKWAGMLQRNRNITCLEATVLMEVLESMPDMDKLPVLDIDPLSTTGDHKWC
jgi:hypothetical protein